METFVEPDNGSELDLAALYAAQAGRVWQFVRASVRAPDPVIEDACQFAWSRLVVHRRRVRPETASAWLVRTAVHEAFKLLRREGRELSLDALVEQAGEAGGAEWAGRAPIASLEDLVAQRARLTSIGVLPARQQRLVWLQGLGLSYAEIAGETGDTTRTVERQLLRAKRSLARAAA